MSVSRYDILKAFATSRKKGTAIGIRLQGRPTLLITTISEITGRSQEDTRVELHHQSIYGDPIAATCLALSEIENVFNLRIVFNDPFYVYLRSLRENIRTIRAGAGFEKATVSR
jgi:hypothetical protein